MSFKKPSPGTHIAQSPLYRASFQSRLVDVVEAHSRGRRTGQRRSGTGRDPVKVRNSTGADLARGHVCQLGDELLDDKTEGRFWFEGDAVADPAWAKFAIAKRPIKQDDMGPVVCQGTCIAVVDVQATTDTHAYPVDGDYVLTSGPAGPVEILGAIDGTGEQELLVCVTRNAYSIVGTLDDDLLADDVEIVTVSSGSQQEVSGDLIESDMYIPSGTLIKADPVDGVFYADTSKACPLEGTP